MDSVMEDLLECSICMDPYDDTKEKTPKVLQCQHTFCFECLHTLHKKRKIRCPTCRDECRLSAANLQTNLTVVHLLDLRKEMGEPTKADATCEGCRTLTICATTTEEKRMCRKCFQKILKTKKSSAQNALAKLTEKLTETEKKVDEHDRLHQIVDEAVKDIQRQPNKTAAVRLLLSFLEASISSSSSNRLKDEIKECKEFLSSSENTAKASHMKGSRLRLHEVKLDDLVKEAGGRLKILTVHTETIDTELVKYNKIKEDVANFKPESTKKQSDEGQNLIDLACKVGIVIFLFICTIVVERTVLVQIIDAVESYYPFSDVEVRKTTITALRENALSISFALMFLTLHAVTRLYETAKIVREVHIFSIWYPVYVSATKRVQGRRRRGF